MFGTSEIRSYQSHPLKNAPGRARTTLNGPIFASCKMPEFCEKSPISGAGKHPDFQVTSCLQNDSTNVDFAYIESE